jgi:hypothetical protein
MLQVSPAALGGGFNFQTAFFPTLTASKVKQLIVNRHLLADERGKIP